MERLVTFEQNNFQVRFPYNPELVNEIKNTVPYSDRTFFNDGRSKYWLIRPSQSTALKLAEFAAAREFAVDTHAAAKLRELTVTEVKPNIRAKQVGGQIVGFVVETPGRDDYRNSIIKDGEGRWDGEARAWDLPFEQKAVNALNRLIAEFRLTIEPGLVEKAADQFALLANFVEMSRMDSSDLDIPVPEGLAYLGYQKAGIAYGIQKVRAGAKGFILGDDPGLGKTIQAVGFSNAMVDIRRVLVICPATLKRNWRREWLKWDTKGLSVGIVEGEDPTGWLDADVTIMNYGIVKAHRAKLMAQSWDLIVIDEAHYLANQKTQRTCYILGGKLGTGAKAVTLDPIPCKYLVPMTGTLIKNKPREIWPVIAATNPTRYNNFFQFGKKYCAAFKSRYGWDFNGASHLEELQADLRANVMVRRKKSEVLKELPPKTRQIIHLDNPSIVAKEAKVLDSIKAKLMKLKVEQLLAYLAGDVNAYTTAARKIVSAKNVAFEAISLLRKQTAVAKIPQVIELVDQALESGKVILFAHHAEVIDAYKNHFGARALVIDGRTPNDKRDEYVQAFQNDPQYDLVICSILAAGIGITLTASSHVIFGEFDWVPGNMIQAEDRAHRIGQKDNVLVWHPVIDGTIDGNMIATLVAKQEICDRAMDAPTTLATATVLPAEEVEVGTTVLEVPELQVVSPEEIEMWLAAQADRRPAKSANRRNERTADRATDRAAARGFAKEAAAMTTEEIQAVHMNLQAIAGVCDGAREEDGVGFNAGDAAVGRALASMPELNALQAAYARQMVRKYVGQLGAAAIDGMWSKEVAA